MGSRYSSSGRFGTSQGRGFDRDFETRGNTEQMGYDEERWRRNQDWSPSQERHSQRGGEIHEDTAYGYGASGRGSSDFGRGDLGMGGGEGDFRSYQGESGFGAGSYGYGASGSQGGYSGSQGTGEYDRRERGQSYGGSYGSQGGFGGGYGRGPGSYGEGRYGQSSYDQESHSPYDQGQFGQSGYGQGMGSRGNQFGSQGYGSASDQLGSQSRFGSTGGQFGSQGSYSSKQTGFRGKGPKGYTRSDQRIEEDVNERLSDDHYLDASNIEVQVQSGTVTLSGEVEDRESKRRAEDIVESCSGVQQVQNNIRVQSSSSSSWFGNGSDEQEDQSGSASTASPGSSSKKAGSSGT